MTKQFFQAKKADDKGEAKAAAPKKKLAQCLDPKKSQAVEIFLNANGVTIDDVKKCVLELDDKVLNCENLGKVLENYPSSEELATLTEFKANNDPKVVPWGRAETFLVDLMDISEFSKRAECCITRAMFKDEFANITQDIATFETCLGRLCNSTGLRTIFSLVVQMGNYLNYGTAKGAQRGFSLDSLPLLTRIEGFEDKTYSLMRFLVDALQGDQNQAREDALEDMRLCEGAARLDFGEAERQLKELENGVKKVSAVVGQTEAEGMLKDPVFESTMRKFVAEATAQTGVLKTHVDKVNELHKEMVDLYAEKPKTPIGEVLKKFADFRKDLEEARKANLLAQAKRAKAEKKAREAEEKKAKAGASKDKDSKTKADAKAKVSRPAPKSSAKEAADGEASPSRHLKKGGGGGAPVPFKKKAMMVKIPDKHMHLFQTNAPGGHLRRNPGEVTPSAKDDLGRATMGPGERPSAAALMLEKNRMTLGPGDRPHQMRLFKDLPESGRASIAVPRGMHPGNLLGPESGRASIAVPRRPKEAP